MFLVCVVSADVGRAEEDLVVSHDELLVVSLEVPSCGDVPYLVHAVQAIVQAALFDEGGL